jgi:hypothetical protein
VLSLPTELRFHLGRDEGLLTKLRANFVRSVRGWLRAKARAIGVGEALTGAVVFTQRFSSRLLFYPHFHAVIPDGIFALDGQGGVVFHELHPKQEDLVQIVKRIARKTARLVKRLDLGSMESETLD